MHGIYFPEETAIRPGPVWQLGKGLSSEKYRPSSEELAALKTQELICKGLFLPPNTYDCGSFVVN